MADRSDGSIVISTQMDNKGFESGSRELVAAIRSLIAKINELKNSLDFGRTVQNSINSAAQATQQAAETASSATRTVAEETQQAAEAAGEATRTMGEQAQQAAETAGQAQQETAQRTEETARANEDAVHSFEDYVDAVELFIDTCNHFNPDNVDEASQVLSDLRSQLEEFGNTQFNIDGNVVRGEVTPQFQDMQGAINRLQDALDESVHGPEWVQFRQNWQSMGSLSGMIGNAFQSAFSRIQGGVRTAGAAISTCAQHPLQALDRALGAAARGAINATSALTKLTGKVIITGLKKIGEHAKSAASNLARMAASHIQDGVKKLGDKIKGLGKSAKDANKSIGLNIKSLLMYTIGLTSLQTIFTKVRSTLSEGFQEIAKSDQEFNDTMSEFVSSLAYLKNSISAAFAPIAEFVVPVLTQLCNALATATSYLGQFFSALTGKGTYKKALPVQKQYVDNTDDMSTNADNATDAMNDEADAAQELKKQFASFDDVQILDSDNGKSKLDAGTIATPNGGNAGMNPDDIMAGFEETAIEDRFKDLIDRLKKMWDEADFTDLGKKLGESLKNALDSIPWDAIQEVAGKLGKSLATMLNGFTEVPGLFTSIGNTIAQGINTIFTLLDEFVTNAHWDSYGQAIHDLIMGIINMIDWGTIYHTVSEAGKGIGTALETAFDNPEIWTGIFTSFANGLKAVLLGIDGFITSINWGSLAMNIATGMNAGIEAIPWDLLGRTLSDVLQAAIDFAYNWLTTFDFWGFGNHIGTTLAQVINSINWVEGGTAVGAAITGLFNAIDGFIQGIPWADLGVKVGNFLNAAMELGIDWNVIAQTLIDLLNAAFDFWYNWVTTFDFTKFGEHIGNTLSQVINNVNWVEGGASVAATMNGLLDALNGFVTTTDWGSIGQAVIDVIAGFLGEFDWSNVSEFISACFMGLCDCAKGALGEIPWEDIPSAIGDKIGEFLSGFDWSEIATTYMEALGTACGAAIKLVVGLAEAVGEWICSGIDGAKDYFSEKIEECGGNIVAGIFKGITDAFVDVVTWIKDNIVDPFIEGVKSVFGIASPATTMLEIGGYIIEGLLNGIIEGLVDIVTWLTENVFNPIFDGIKSLFGIGEGESVLVSVGKDLIGGLLGGIIGGLEDIGEWLSSNIFDPVVGGIKSLFGIGEGESVLVSVGKDLIGGLKDGMQNVAESAGDFISEHVTGPITGFFKKHFGTEGEEGESILTDVGSKVVNGLKNGMKSVAESAGDFVKNNIVGKFTGFFKKHFGTDSEDDTSVLTDVGTQAIEGLKGGLQTAAENAGGFIKDHVTGPICGFFKDLFEINSPSKVFEGYGGYLMEGLENGIDDNKDTVTDSLGTIKDDTKKTWDDINDDTNKTWQDINKNASKEFSELSGTAETETGKSDSSFTTNWGASGATVTRILGLMREDVSRKMKEIWDTVKIQNENINLLIETQWGLQSGIVSGKLDEVNTTTGTKMQEMVTTVSTTLSGPTGLQGAMNTALNSMSSAITQNWANLTGVMRNLANDMKVCCNAGWMDIGINICNGIYNGLIWGWNWLTTTANNLATEIYNSAAGALGIASPSKKFHWISEMIVAGMVNGLEDTGSDAVNAIGAVADAMVDEASGLNPIDAGIEGSVDGIDAVLTTFSDKVLNGFSDMISAMQQITDRTALMIPAVAAGSTVPYAVTTAAGSTSRTNDDVAAAMQLLAARSGDQLTRRDLLEVMTVVFQQYMNIAFYIGDEQVARHANAGNDMLSRRFNMEVQTI